MSAVCAAIFACAALALPATTVSSLSVPDGAVYGQTVSITGVYPDYARKKIGRQQMFQPQFGVYCYQGGALAWASFTGPGKETNLGGGWWQATVQFTLGGTANGYTWTSGPASCSALLGYFTRNQDGSLTYHQLASASFDVSV